MKFRWIAVCVAAAGLVAATDMTYTQAQQLLKEKGYYTGQVDGLTGPQTQAAITAFQRDQGLPATGNLDDRTAKQLQASTMGETVGTMKGAGKEAGSSFVSETKSAWGEIKSVFSSGKKQPKPPAKQ